MDGEQPKLRSYPWYIDRHEENQLARTLTLAEEGLLRRLLDHQYKYGSIQLDPVENLCKSLRISCAEFRKNWGKVQGFFDFVEGNISNKLAVSTRKQKVEFLDNQKVKNSGAAHAKWRKQKELREKLSKKQEAKADAECMHDALRDGWADACATQCPTVHMYIKPLTTAAVSTIVEAHATEQAAAAAFPEPEIQNPVAQAIEHLSYWTDNRFGKPDAETAERILAEFGNDADALGAALKSRDRAGGWNGAQNFGWFVQWARKWQKHPSQSE